MILKNRQSNRHLFDLKNKQCLALHQHYVNILEWINRNESILLVVMPELIDELNAIRQKVSQQKNSLEDIVGSERAVGKLQNLLSRIEREWISFTAVGAKRQGKGHTLSTLLGLQPENDIFLARRGKPCTATVVTLHQGPKRKAVFNANNESVSWVEESRNKAYVYCYSTEEIAATIQKYFNVIGLIGVFSPADSSRASFVAECDRWYKTVSSYTSPTGQTEYLDLLKEYLGQSRKYVMLLKESISDSEPVAPIDVCDIELVDGTKIDFANEELRKYISYYRRNDDCPHYDVLAVKKVEIYTDYKLGGQDGGCFVIGDTAGVGEFKINLIETLRSVLQNDIDIAIGVTKVPTDENGDLQIPQDVYNYHNAIKGCFVSAPHQFYYIINASEQARNEYSEQEIEKYRLDLIADLRNKEIIPSVGDKKYESASRWTAVELETWENTHVVILDSDDFEEVNSFIANVVLPQVSRDLPIVDRMLLNEFSHEIRKQEDAWEEIKAMIKSFLSKIPCDDTDIDVKKREEITEKILIPMREELANLRTALSRINSLHGNNEAYSIYPEILQAVELLGEFEDEFKSFYLEPDRLRCFACMTPGVDANGIITEREKEECRTLKEKMYDSIGTDEETTNLKAVEDWYINTWKKGPEHYNYLLNEFKCVLSGTINSIDDDEMRSLVEYRSVVVKQLEELTKQLFTDKAAKAYQLIIDLVWRIVAQHGNFMQDSTVSCPMSAVLGALDSNPTYGHKVIGCFDTLELKTLCAAPAKLSNDLETLLAKSKIQPLTYISDSNRSPVEILSVAFAHHLMSIEQEYKLRMAIRFKEESMLSDFQASFFGVISKLSNYLLPQKVTVQEPYVSTQKAFMNFCLAEYDKLFPDNKYAMIKSLSRSIVELQDLI